MKNLGFIAYLMFAVLVAGGLAVLGFLTSNEPAPKAQLEFSADDYEPVNASSIDVADTITWDPPTPQSQGENWLFGVFTPPKIYKHPKTGEFTAVPYIEEKAPEVKPENQKPPFGLAFVSFYQHPFRVAMQSVIASPQGSLIQMEIRSYAQPTPGVSEYKLVEKRPLIGEPGKYYDPEKLRIDGVENRQVRDVNGNDRIIEVVKVTDFTDKRTYELLANEQAMTPYFWVTLQSTSNPAAAPVFLKNPAAGTKFTLNNAEYTITELKAGPALAVTKTYKHVPREGEDPEDVVETQDIALGAAPAVAPAPGGAVVPPPAAPGVPAPPVPGALPPVPGGTPVPAPPVPGALPPLPGGIPVPAPLPTAPPTPSAAPTSPPSPAAPPAPAGLPFPGALPVPGG